MEQEHSPINTTSKWQSSPYFPAKGILAVWATRFLALVVSIAGLLLAPQSRAQVIISEFMADNDSNIRDDMNQYSDWIEVCNISSTNVNLLGWGLSDTANRPFLWQFPSTNLAPGANLVVFATDLDRRIAGATLHTNFKLSAGGEYLALTRPNSTAASVFSNYPIQIPNVSYGYSRQTAATALYSAGWTGRVRVPSDGSLGLSWTAPEFNDSSWGRATNGVGFEVARSFPTNLPGDVWSDAPVGYWRLNEVGTNKPAANAGSLGSVGNGTYVGTATNAQAGPRLPQFTGLESSNTAARINGSGGYINVPWNAALNPSGPFTVECWVKPTAAGGAQAIIGSQDRSAGRKGYVLYRSTQWEFLIGDGSGYVATARAGLPVAGAWTHLAGVFDGSIASLYVDGTLMAAVAATRAFVPNGSVPLRIGLTSNDHPFSGDVDEVAFFNRALTAEEISTRYETAIGSQLRFTGLIKTDLRSAMHNVNSTALLRLPFVLSDPGAATRLLLRLKYNDGFAALLNGYLVAQDNTPPGLEWNSAAPQTRSSADAVSFVEFDLSDQAGSLRRTNVLALQLLNVAATNSDLLGVAEVEVVSAGLWQTNTSYFTSPTPGSANGLGFENLGPILSTPAHTPLLPGVNDNITVTCQVEPALAPVANVTLSWRVMYGTTNTLAMFDDGLHGDGGSGDGLYGAVIQAQQGQAQTYSAGQMVRWFVTATDTQSRSSRWPVFYSGVVAEEHLGTVIEPGYSESTLPVIHLFVQDYANGVGVDNPNKVGGRASVYYDGELYDNVFMKVRGNTTAGYAKKSHRIEFHSSHKFRHPGPSSTRLGKTSFTADYPDPSYCRQRLSFWLAEQLGAPGPFYHPVRLQMNGEFYQLANHNDLHGEEMLERLGFDPDGALYNAAGQITPGKNSTGGFEKKTRRWEGDADYLALANGIAEGQPLSAREINVFDMLDLPQVINYMATARFVHENDDVWANMTVYRDSDGDGLWRIIPFDMNLSWGAAFMDTSYDDGLQTTNDVHKSFPMYGSDLARAMANPGAFNRLYDVIFSVPKTREMFLRRVRTMMEKWIKPPGTPLDQLVIEPMLRQWRDEIAEDAAIDRAVWGWPGKGGQCNFPPGISPYEGVEVILGDFLPRRRAHFLGKHSVTNTSLTIGISKTQNAGIPLSQPADPIISILGWDYNPASGDQEHEYICLTNANDYAVDVTGWRITGGIQQELQRGTVIPARTALYLTPNATAFRSRPTTPRGGMGLFVQGSYTGELSARGDSFSLVNPEGERLQTVTYEGSPSIAQLYLRITEVMYNPAPAPAINTDAQQFEYLELKNISTTETLDLSNVRVTQGVTFTFPIGSTLGPGQFVLLVRNEVAFSSLYGLGFPIAGQYSGALNNGGEVLRLEDGVGEKILEFEYRPDWYPVTDGAGFSLVIVNELEDWSTWGLASSWRPSSRWNGSPAQDDPAPITASVRVNEVLAHPTASGSDWVELVNRAETNVNIFGWYVTDDGRVPKKYRIPTNVILEPNEHILLSQTEFGAGTNGFAFSEYGESVYIFAADAAGVLSGYQHGFEFGAAPNGMSFGQHTTSQNEVHFVLQSATTPWAPNAAPSVGPVVFSEVMYNPPGTLDEEFIELENIMATATQLYCTFTNEFGYGAAAATNTWRLRGGVDFDFPQGTVLGAGQRLLVVGFDPATNATKLNTFRTRYGVAAEVPIYGPYAGGLNNAGDNIRLLSPDRPDVDPLGITVPYVLRDALAYGDASPWPTGADGNGASLQRRNSYTYGNDPINWFAAPPTAGQSNPFSQPSILGVAVNGTTATVMATAQSGRTYTLEYMNSLANGSWLPITPSVVASGSTVVLVDGSAAAQSRFYRVRVQ